MICGLLALAGLPAAPARGEEGMWLLNKPPLELLKSRHNFEPSPAWLLQAQRAAVRFEGGGTGSFVSADGLVMTNHHVAADDISKLSTPTRNLMRDGFLARTREDEIPCKDLEVRVLWEIRDVTDRVNASVTPGLTEAQAGAARRAMIATIEKESFDATGMRSQVVTLYHGAQYHLYTFKSYTDVRLVFAPEESIAFFGGDTDNFEFPRFNLDVTFFRVYENGKPLRPEHFFPWSKTGAQDGESVFVFGHPGRTRRLFTLDHLRFLRDVELPERLARTWRNEIKLQTFSGRSDEQARIARDDLFGTANGRKVFTGLLAGMHDPAFTAARAERDAALRSFMEQADVPQERRDRWLSSFARIAEAQRVHAEIAWERGAIDWLGRSGILRRAQTILRLADELPKPSSQRLRGFSDAELPSLELDLYSPEPLYPALEAEKIASWLSLLAERLGGEHPLVLSLLDGHSPRERAAEVVARSTLASPDARRALVKGGKVAVDQARDPAIELVRVVDARSRELRSIMEDRVESVERSAYAALADALFAKDGDRVWPDATFSLRLSTGRVRGVERDQTPAFTTFAGLYERFEQRRGQDGFALPQRWVDARSRLGLDTPFNFISTNDIIGGNSGSAIVNTRNEVVGLIFDGNLDSLVGDVAFDAVNARAVSVDVRGMREALRVVYGADALLAELDAPR